MSYVSARSVELTERVEYESRVYHTLTGEYETPNRIWTAELNGANTYPYGRITISRTGDTAKEATENLKAAVIEQGYDWSET